MIIKAAILLLLCLGEIFAISPIIVTAGETGRQGYDSKCIHEPLLACRNISNAHDCGMVKYCISNVWKYWTLEEDNDDICTICKEMIKEARDQLESNETREEIKEVFDGSCKLIPIKAIANECCKIADQFIPELVETLASEMNPQLICATAGLCNSNRIDMLLKNRKEKSPCDRCHDHTTELQKYLQQSPKSAVLESALKACGYLKSFSTSCKNTIINHFNDWHDFVSKGVSNVDDTCALFGYCHQLVPVDNNVKSDSTCEFCETIVKHWIDVLTSGTTEEEFKQILHALCERTGKYKSECDIFVDDYFAELYELLVNEVNATELCEAVGLCHKEQYENIWSLIPSGSEDKVKHLLSDEIIGKDEANSLHDNQLHRVQLSNDNSIQPSHSEIPQLPFDRLNLAMNQYNPHKASCVLCEYVLHEIQNFLNEKSTENEIKEAVGKVCSVLPENLSEECHNFIEQYGDYVITLLIQKIDPSQVCTLLKICPSQQLRRELDVGCDTCEFAINELRKYLEDEPTEESIRHTLKELCGYLPDSVTDECKEFVDEYEDMIVEAIIAGLDADEVCTYLKLCEAKAITTTTPVQEVQDNNIASSPGCVICEFAMTELASILKDKKTDEEIIDAIENICQVLPKSVKSECKKFIDTYGQVIIELIVEEGRDPHEACSEIGLCDSVIEALKLDKCDGCRMVVSYVDKLLVDDRVEERIDYFMEKVCNFVPPSYAKRCKKIIHVYGPYLIGLLGEFGDPDKVCSAISLCQNHVNLLGKEKCTWGPSYWCISPFHAKSCGAIEHCKSKVWKKQGL